MAKVGAGFVGILTIFLVIYNINICASNPSDESKCVKSNEQRETTKYNLNM